MAQQFSYDHITHLRDLAAQLDGQAIAHELLVRQTLAAVDLAHHLAVNLRVGARAQCVATARLVTALGDRRQRDGGELSLPHAVLVVDDYEDSRESLSMILHNAGFIVRTATNGLEAVIAAYEMRPAVIVMDIMMPVLNGVEATRLIKAIDELHEASVIAYTAKPTVDDAQLFSSVLMKPASPDRVVAAVHRSLAS